MTHFRNAKVCNKWIQERIDDHRKQSDYNYKSELQKSRRKEIYTWYYICVVTPHDTLTTWAPWPRTPSTQRSWTLTCECAVSHVRVVIDSHYTAWLKGVAHVISSTYVMSVSPRPWSPLSFTSSSSHSSFISCTSSRTSSTTLRAVATLRTPPKRVWTLLTTPTSSQVMSPTPTTSRRLTSSPTRVLDPPTVPEQGFLEDVEYVTPHLRICFTKHTEYMSITPSEKACLSVSRRRQCPSERCDPLESEQDDLLDQVVWS